jgi:hypothetical protein
MILWYASGNESLLTRFAHACACGHRWRHVACRCCAHLSCQLGQHQALAALAPDNGLTCSQAAHGQGCQHFSRAAGAPALPTRTMLRCHLGRARGALERRPRHRTQVLDAGTGNCRCTSSLSALTWFRSTHTVSSCLARPLPRLSRFVEGHLLHYKTVVVYHLTYAVPSVTIVLYAESCCQCMERSTDVREDF